MPTVDEEIRAALDDPEALYAALFMVTDAIPLETPAMNMAKLVVSAAVDEMRKARTEVDRLARACTKQMYQAERDRDELLKVARGVLRRLDLEYARHFARRDAPIAGLTLSVGLDVDTVRRLLASYDKGMAELKANLAESDKEG